MYCEFILGFAQEGAAEEPIKCDGPCDPCVCREIPGLVYNAEINGCAWPDEVGCALSGKLKSNGLYLQPSKSSHDLVLVMKFEFCAHSARLLRKLDHVLLWILSTNTGL